MFIDVLFKSISDPVKCIVAHSPPQSLDVTLFAQKETSVEESAL